MDEGEKEYQLPVSVKDQKVLIWCLLRGWQKYVQLQLWPVSSAFIPQQNAEFYRCTFHISDENIKMMQTELGVVQAAEAPAPGEGWRLSSLSALTGSEEHDASSFQLLINHFLFLQKGRSPAYQDREQKTTGCILHSKCSNALLR